MPSVCSGRLGETLRKTKLGVVGVDESFPPAMVYDVRVEQHDELIRRLRAARFRFTDKGDVEILYNLLNKLYPTNIPGTAIDRPFLGSHFRTHARHPIG
eukprot:g65177.t1